MSNRWTIIPLLAITLLLSAAPAQARSFTSRFSQDLSGDIVIASNSLLTCSTSGVHGNNCSASRNNTGLGVSADATLNNNYYEMVPVDIDGDPSTSNSSSANLAIPSGSEIVWAGLYWAAGAPAGMTETQAKSIKLKKPGAGSYQAVVADVYDAAPSESFGYNCFADVTALVQSGGQGTWTAGGVTARIGTGTSNQAGWSLVVVYNNNSEPTRNLTVFDGQSVVAGTDTINIPVSGFRTPPTGAVDTTVGMVTFEGDRGIVGDYAQLDGNTLSDAKHLGSNFFNSWIANKGQAVTSRTPAYSNQLGWDATIISVGDLLGNNATSATLRAKTDGDGYQPLLFTFSTDLYAPHFNPIKTVEDLNGGEVRPDDILEYTIELENDGGDNATEMIFSESSMPSGTTYVGDSVKVDGVVPAPALVDQPADGGSGPLVIRLGTGASASQGGTVAPGESHQIKFQVKVSSPLPAQGSNISNQALMNFVFESLGRPMQVETNVSDIQVKRPDFSITKTKTSAQIADGLPGQYTLAVSNTGLSSGSGTITVTDLLPVQFKNPTISSSSGWVCSIVSRNLSCSRSDALAPGQSYPSIVVDSPAMDIPGGETVSNTASVVADFDADPSNNSSTVSTSEQGTSNLATNNTAGSASAAPGQTIQWTADYSNTGPSTAVNPSLTWKLVGASTADAVISDYSVSSSNGSISKDDCALSTPSNIPTITCTPGALAKDATVQIVVSLQVLPGTELTQITTRSSIQAANDPGSPRQDDAQTNMLPSADIQLSKSSNPTQAKPGQSVVYTLLVKNNGPSKSGLVAVTDPVPSGLTVQSATWSKTGGSGSCQVADNTVTCSGISSINPEQEIIVQINAVVAASATGYQNNTASVQGTSADPDPSNNTAQSQFTVLPSVNLEIIKTGPISLAPEQRGTFQLKAINHGPSPSPGTVVKEIIPRGMSLISKLPAGCSRNGQTVSCLAGNMTQGEVRYYRFRLQVAKSIKPGVSLTNRATIAGTTTELVPSNNSDQVQTQIRKPGRPRLGIQLWINPQKGSYPGQLVKVTVKIRNLHYATVYRPKACITVPLNLWGNPYRHICWWAGPMRGYTSKSFQVWLLTRQGGMGLMRAGTEAENAWWTGTKKWVSVQGGFTG